MIPTITDPVELRRRGFETLVASLGWTNAVRFIQQYEAGQHDYTREREHLLPEWDAETLVRNARTLASRMKGGTEKTLPLSSSKPKRKQAPKSKRR